MLQFFTLPTKLAASRHQADQAAPMQKTEPTHVPKEFSFNTTILGSRLWIKGDAHLLENGTVTAYAQEVWDRDLKLSLEVREGSPMYFAAKEELTRLLQDKTFHNYLVYDCSIHF
jgi:hypothetical protein